MTKSIEIPIDVLQLYVSHIIDLIMLEEEERLANLPQVSDEIFCARKRAAISENDFDVLKLGIDYVLETPGFDSSRLVRASEWDWEDHEVRPILREMRRRMWPDQPTLTAQTLRAIIIVPESLSDWRARQARHR